MFQKMIAILKKNYVLETVRGLTYFSTNTKNTKGLL